MGSGWADRTANHHRTMMFLQRPLSRHAWWLSARSHQTRNRRSRCAALTTTTTTANDNGSNRKRPRVVVAMSGGVDSSVAAHLLQQQRSLPRYNGSATAESSNGGTAKSARDDGADVIGLHMSNWNALDEDSDETKSNQTRERNARSPSSSHSGDGTTNFCQSSEQEYNDAVSVAEHLSMPLHRVSFASEYWIQVFEPFIESLSSSHSTTDSSEADGSNGGVTMPNPDFGCNTYIKFGAMKEYAM